MFDILNRPKARAHEYSDKSLHSLDKLCLWDVTRVQLKAAQTTNPLLAHRNEFESERTRLLWANTPSLPPPGFKQSNRVNTDTEGRGGGV